MSRSEIAIRGRVSHTVAEQRRVPAPLLIVFDATSVLATFALASAVRFEIFRDGPVDLFRGAPVPGLDYSVLAILATPVWLMLLWSRGLYGAIGLRSEVHRIAAAVSLGTILFLVADYLFRLQIARGWSLSCLVIGTILLAGGRTVLRRYPVVR